MGRPKDDQYWNQVTKEENGTWTCMHCNRTFRGGVSRIKAHVDRIKGQGISICSGAHNNDGVHNNMASSSINPPEAVNGENSLRGEVAEGVPETINTSISGPINNPEYNRALDSSLGDGSSGSRAFESEINHLNQLVSDLLHEERNIKEQVQWLQSRGKKRKSQVDIWLDELQELKKRVVALKDLVDPLPYIYGFKLKQLIEEMQEHKSVKPLALSTELVGEVFEINFKKVWELLADDQVFVIGIYGMGGVGKTFLVSQVENEIKRRGTFKHVFWVTVSHNFSIFELQRDIAKEMGVKLDDEDNERRRSRNLSLALETKEKSVLILDDVWKYIDLEKVGIPLKVNGIKVILTTRLKHVCQQMDCLPHNMIQMEPLDYLDGEDLELLMLKLGHNGTSATLSPEVLKIAVSIAKRCCGLPLAISVMARTMKGVDDIHQWKHTWNKLEKLEWREEVEEEVFKVLRRSYDNLMGKDMQNCFLYTALLFDFGRDELIMKLVDNGLIKGRRSLEEIFDEGHTILNNLQAHSLLFNCTAHQLVRDMACRILKESDRHVMVKKHMTRPHMQEWTASNLEFVYLRDDYGIINEIPEGTSPGCPHLSTLIIQHARISQVPECFFVNMNVMAVLDLSYSRRLVSLPNSVSKLRSLISLVLIGCHSLKYVPPLEELQALSRLVITFSLIEQVPQGLQMLINLKWLDLSNNKNLTLATGSVLPNLTNMQYLDLRWSLAMITMEDVQGMKMLERFGVSFFDSGSYNHFVQTIFDTSFGPETYHLRSGAYPYCFENVDLNRTVTRKPKAVWFGDCCEFGHTLPKDLTELCIYDNNQWNHLCHALLSTASYYLSKLKISKCRQLKSVFCLSHCCSFCTKICKLESLDLEHLESLTTICIEDVADIQSLSRGGMFSHLKYFNIRQCHEIETLLTPGTVLQLRNLEMVTVKYCDSMKEIFAVGNGDDGDGSTSSIKLPKLTTLELAHLPQLKTVCKGIIFCRSSPEVDIDNCSELERHPTIEINPSNFSVFGF